MYLATKGNIHSNASFKRSSDLYAEIGRRATELMAWYLLMKSGFSSLLFSMISDQIYRVGLAEKNNLKLVEIRYLKTHERNSSYVYMYKTDSQT